MRRLVVTALIAVPVFLLLSWWNSVVGVLFGIAALTWVLAGLYFRWNREDNDDELQREERHREFFG